MRAPDSNIVGALRDLLGDNGVLDDPDLRAGYEIDWTGRYGSSSVCVAFPSSTDEVKAVLDWCRTNDTPVVVQGGRTGLVGGSVPNPASGDPVILSTARLDWLDPVDTKSGQITCGAAATIGQIQAAAKTHGLRYCVDLASRDSATIGGTIATNAGGHHVLAFGTTRDQVLGVEAVMADGSIVSRLNGLEKDNTGYHLSGLLTGSEGTLGIITAARLRLRPAPPHTICALVSMSSLDTCVDAVASLRGAAIALTALEVMFDDGIALVCEALDQNPPPMAPGPVYLLVEIEGYDLDRRIESLHAALEQLDGVIDTAVAANSAQRERLWSYRDGHTEAVSTIGVPHKLDVSLPLAAVTDFMEALPDLCAPHRAVTWGHLGDGNLHVNLIGPEPDDMATDDKVLAKVIEAGGSVSGEHGIGVAKRSILIQDRTPGDMATMRRIKNAIDPDGFLNPGVLFRESDG